MLSKKIEQALKGQINAELYSSYLYLSMSSFLFGKGLEGGAYWMKVQVLEEAYHGVKLFDYVLARGGRALTQAIAAPPAEWDSTAAVFAAVLAHEQKVTGLIQDLAKLAEAENDRETKDFLAWFLKEQEEEEESAQEVLAKVKKAGTDLAKADLELSRRTFKIPKDVSIKFRNPPA